MATVRIPSSLRKYTGGEPTVSIEAGNVRELLDRLESAHPGIKERICESNGEVRRFVNIFVADEDIRFLDNLDSGLQSNDEISIVPAIAGGSR